MRRGSGSQNALSAMTARKAVTEYGKPSESLLHPQRAPLFSGAASHPIKNLKHFAHPKKKK